MVYWLLGMSVSLTACNPQPASTTPEAPPAAQSSATQSGMSANESQGSEMKETDSAQAEGNAVIKNCREVEFRLVAGPQTTSEGSQTVALHLTRTDGATVQIAPPEEMAGYAPVGLGCTVAESADKPYFVVQYGELPAGCAFCEWFFLYDGEGKQLTRSVPPLLEDETLPEGQRQSSNNAEYETMLGKLGIEHPEVDYIE
jgi:hypothetical protein